MNSSEQLIGSFVAYLRTVRGLAENTVSAYETDIRHFSESFSGLLQDVTGLDIERHIAKMLTDKCSATSAGRRLASLRQFFLFGMDEGWIQKDPTRNVPLPKTWKRLRRTLSEADIEKMIGSLGSSQIELRDRAMLTLFFASGLRNGELTNLAVKDLDLDAGAAKVWNGKGGKDGIVPLSPQAVEAIREYLNSRTKNSPYVFPGNSGKPISRQAVYYRIRSLGRDVLGKEIYPHMLRSSYATALLRGGADVREVQALMRHSSVDTTAIYLNTDFKDLKETYERCHPRAH